MSGIRVSIDPAALRKVRDAAMSAMEDLGEHVLEESNRVVPIEEGTLQRSGNVSSDRGAGKVRIGYDTPYAVRQHEDMDLRHDEGRQAKFLEDAVLGAAPKAGDFIASKMRAVS